jgi:cytochrome c
LVEAGVCDGVYSSNQAQSGNKIFDAQCAQCHGANLRGGFGVASLAGSGFTTLWGNKSLWSLYDKMKSTMPLDRAGTLSDQDYVDVLARILEVNHFPASHVAELPLQREGLERMTLPKKCP